MMIPELNICTKLFNLNIEGLIIAPKFRKYDTKYSHYATFRKWIIEIANSQGEKLRDTANLGIARSEIKLNYLSRKHHELNLSETDAYN